MTEIIQTFTMRGDLAHLALLLWASSASGLLVWSLRELSSAVRRFDDFVRELARFNAAPDAADQAADERPAHAGDARGDAGE